MPSANHPALLIPKVAPVAPMSLSLYYLYKRPSDWKVAVSTLIFSSALLVAGLR